MEASPQPLPIVYMSGRTLGRTERVTGSFWSFYFRRDIYKEGESLQGSNYSPYSPNIINLKRKV